MTYFDFYRLAFYRLVCKIVNLWDIDIDKHGVHNKCPKRIIFCCHRQMFKDIYANLPLKLPNLSFSTFEFNMKSWVPPFLSETLSPILVCPSKIFSGSPNFLIFKIWFPPFERGGGGTHYVFNAELRRRSEWAFLLNAFKAYLRIFTKCAFSKCIWIKMMHF